MIINRLVWIKILVIMIPLLFLSGCTSNDLDSNKSQQQSPLPITSFTYTPTNQATAPAISTTIGLNTTITSPIPSSPKPIFTETGPTTDANGTRILSKSQAWSNAETYLGSRGLTNIQPDEVKSYGPKIFTDKEKNQRLIWTFEIDRKDSMGFERGGIVAIDAHNGEVVWYAAFG